jgi:Immunoglobulin-like domain of bacterial spore germination
MTRAAMAALLAVVAIACTKPVERVTEALTPSPSASETPTGDRLTEIVGDAIVVETPFADGDVGTPVSVTGTADVVGASVTVRVLDDAGGELAQTIVQATCGDGCVGTFAAELFYFVPKRTSGWIEVSGASAEGPAPRVRVPVILFP